MRVEPSDIEIGTGLRNIDTAAIFAIERNVAAIGRVFLTSRPIEMPPAFVHGERNRRHADIDYIAVRGDPFQLVPFVGGTQGCR